MTIGVIGLVVGVVIFIRLILATALSRIGTPPDLGAGFQVPGAAERERRRAESRQTGSEK